MDTLIAPRPPALRGATQIRRTLVAASMLIGSVELALHRDGWSAVILLNPTLVRARASLQGLPDASVPAAAASPRVQTMMAEIVEAANRGLPPDQQIVAHAIGERPGPAR